MAKTTTFPLRYSAYAISIAGLVISLPVTIWMDAGYVFPLIFAILTAIGTRDLLQRRHTVSRNYPIMANFRYLFESVGPEIRQYFIQSDTEERPFSREQR
ncbi:MAG: glutamate synthase, partial [Marinobacter sp. T13-3]